jgi:hypothetical protein
MRSHEKLNQPGPLDLRGKTMKSRFAPTSQCRSHSLGRGMTHTARSGSRFEPRTLTPHFTLPAVGSFISLLRTLGSKVRRYTSASIYQMGSSSTSWLRRRTRS